MFNHSHFQFHQVSIRYREINNVSDSSAQVVECKQLLIPDVEVQLRPLLDLMSSSRFTT